MAGRQLALWQQPASDLTVWYRGGSGDGVTADG